MYRKENRQELAPFVNLRSDVGFKAVFADRDNKDILIGVLNQILPPEARIEDIKEYSDREQQQDVIYGKKTVLDLVCVDKEDRLFYIFRNSGGFQKIPEWIEEAGGISRRLAEACEVAAFDKEKKLKYEIDKMNERDILAQRVFAERKGFEAGYADGEAKGLADGTAKGMAKGMAEGITEGKAEVAKAMLEIGMPIGQILQLTGFTEEQVKALR